MTKIEPYLNIDDAIESLDNGGRFYNILTSADDGVISQSELGKVAGLLNDKQQMILFFEISISNLNADKRNEVISKLEDKLKETYLKFKPLELLPSEAFSKGTIASNAIITGIPTLIESKDEFTGFILIPIYSGEITTFSMIPLIDLYDVYELKDEKSDEKFLIAHVKSENKLPEKKIKVAGILKELKLDKEEDVASEKYLEAVYHLEVN
ncbi:hypothetical protein [uncultured Arcticibacterium sp.]|uniref:hypothetical protein n=1 Tax=uncultured Arcticibacterium sp. TaxID=2173042 RepID=UPI0030FA178E